MMSERIPRHFPRVSLAHAGLPCVVLPSDAGRPSEEGVLTVLSPGGGFVETGQMVDVGSWVGLRFVLPDTGEEIICGGIVRNHVEASGFGIEFTLLSSIDYRRLRSAVDGDWSPDGASRAVGGSV